MSSTSRSRNQTKLELEVEQAIELFFDSITPIVPVFLRSGQESDHEQVIEAAQALILLYQSDSKNAPLTLETPYSTISTASTANSSPTIASSSTSSSASSFVTANLFSDEVPEVAKSVTANLTIDLFNDEVLEEAKSVTSGYISMILTKIEMYSESICRLVREYLEAEQDSKLKTQSVRFLPALTSYQQAKLQSRPSENSP
jgi:hypothetical protein